MYLIQSNWFYVYFFPSAWMLFSDPWVASIIILDFYSDVSLGVLLKMQFHVLCVSPT